MRHNTATTTMTETKCECECGCDALATCIDEGTPLCDECAQSSVPRRLRRVGGIDEGTALGKCECECGCEAPATCIDEGVPLCDECADYYTDSDGQVVCSREQDEEVCRHCGTPIVWGRPIPGGPGTACHRSGRCACRPWIQEDRGGTWVMGEGGSDDDV